jgi:phosphate-selective porin OprO and OprP
VTSSGDLQLPDRSIVNTTFNIDRDFGLQFYYNNDINKMSYILRGAITSGDGRNITASDEGLAYTGRVELQPLGRFTNGGDYFEGDLAREPKPKIAFGVTFSSNQNAIRTGGQLGKDLYASRDIGTGMADFLFKYNGWSFAAEYLRRDADDPITMNEVGDVRYVYVGHGQNFQGGYLFRDNFEIVGRYSKVRPDSDIQDLEPMKQQYAVGATKYIRGHRLKIQSDLTYEHNSWLSGPNPDKDFWMLRFQIEVGI